MISSLKNAPRGLVDLNPGKGLSTNELNRDRRNDKHLKNRIQVLQNLLDSPLLVAVWSPVEEFSSTALISSTSTWFWWYICKPPAASDSFTVSHCTSYSIFVANGGSMALPSSAPSCSTQTTSAWCNWWRDCSRICGNIAASLMSFTTVLTLSGFPGELVPIDSCPVKSTVITYNSRFLGLKSKLQENDFRSN